MRKFVLATTLIAVLAAPAFAGRIDVNGGMESSWDTAWASPTEWNNSITPNSWTRYNTQATPTAVLGSMFREGGTTDSVACEWEDEGRTVAGYRVQQGHSLRLSDAGTGGKGQWGVKQSFSATAGKLYWMTGSTDYDGDANIQFDFGLQMGDGIDKGIVTNPNSNLKGGTLGAGSMFNYSMIAGETGAATMHVGHNNITGNEAWQTTYVDGIRLYEWDIPVFNGLQNGNFEGTFTDLTDYDARGNGSPTIKNMEMAEGWLLLGNSAGNVNRYLKATDGSSVFAMDQFKAIGRMYAFQRINMGAGKYDVSGAIKTWGLTEGNGKIGVDFSGGLDPNAASVVWTESLAAVQTWTNKSLSGDAGANGITIFLASGQNGLARSGGSGMSYFDNINLNFTAVPEPSSILALASGLVGMAGFAIRRRK